MENTTIESVDIRSESFYPDESMDARQNQRVSTSISGANARYKVFNGAPSKPNRIIFRFIQWGILYAAIVIVLILLIWTAAKQETNNESVHTDLKELHTDLKELQQKQTDSEETIRKTFEALTTNISRPENTTATSCLQLRERGVVTDGYYDIKFPKETHPIYVYCDMTTDGGGWTLVASVHEDEIQRKCDAQDLWSTYLTRDRADYAGKGNWENDITFGNVLHLHVRDYKNAGYFKLNASDVMIWHVLPSFQSTTLKSSSKLRYRTEDRFLAKYGGNLRTLYDEHYPLKVETESEYNKRKIVRGKIVLDALENSAGTIKSMFPDFYEYDYGTRSNQIRDSNLYSSYGNYLYFYGSYCSSFYLVYGESRTCRSAIVSSRKTHPFFSVAVIHDEVLHYSYYDLRVRSYRPTRYDRTTFHRNTLTNGNFELRYEVVQFQYANSTSYTTCEFHYVVSNVKDWNSPTSISLYRSSSYNSYYNSYHYNTYRAYGYPLTNVVMGYALFARSNSKAVTNSELNDVGRAILEVYANLTALFGVINEFASLAVPVTFDHGSAADVIDTVPPFYRDYVEPGFIQFRAYNKSGFPNALCPAVRLRNESALPEYICIGGVSGNVGDHGTCGDFAGWDGTKNDDVQRSTAVGSAHSFDDIFSSLLLFYR